MTKVVYLEQFVWIIPMLIIDLIVPVIKFIPNLRKKAEFKIDGDFIGFVITMLLANCFVAYIIGVLGYVSFNEEQIHPYGLIWIVSFVVLCSIEFFIYLSWINQEAKARIEISMSPNDYKELILNAEKGAKTIWLMPKRMHVMFKSEAFIHYLAVKRFGTGSEYIQAYEDEHIARKSALYQGLNNGLVIHELHNKKI